MHAPTGGWQAPATAAAARIAPSGAPSGSVASTTIAAAASGAPMRRTSVWPRRSTIRASAGFDSAEGDGVGAGREAALGVGPGQLLGVQDEQQPERAHGQPRHAGGDEEAEGAGGTQDVAHAARVPTPGARAKRFGSGRIHRQAQRARLEVEQGALVLEPAAVAGQRAVAADDAVARADDGDRVAAVGAADGAGLAGVADARGDLAVAGGLAIGDRPAASARRAARRRAAAGAAARSKSVRSPAKYSRSWATTVWKRGSSETSPAPKPMRVTAPSSATVTASGPTGEGMVVCMSCHDARSASGS